MKNIFFCSLLLLLMSCNDDFLDRYPLDSPSAETFWTSADNAELWVNNLYRGLPGPEDSNFEGYSDNAWPRAGEIGRGSYQTDDPGLTPYWDYSYIQKSLELLERIDDVPDISQQRKAELTGQARFILSFKYYQLITLFRDVPLVTKTLAISESDIPKSSKQEILNYVLLNLDKAIEELPVNWTASQTGRITKGAALALKARVLLYNQRWSEAASAAKQVMDLQVYKLHPVFGQLFLRSYNNKTSEVILARQYGQGLSMHNIFTVYAFMDMGGFGSQLPLPSLVSSYECTDGLSVAESPLYNVNDPFKNRDPRFYDTFIYPFQSLNGVYYDPINGDPSLIAQATTYMYYRKYINDMQRGELQSWVNWIIFRYADVLLMYAEAKNEADGPDDSVYSALDQVRMRAGMPAVNRTVYDTKDALRKLIRNERRVEFAGEGLRYFDIIRWRVAEQTQNVSLRSVEVPNLLPSKMIETRVFNPAKHYVWPIPQFAIDRAKHLEQHTEWK